MRWGVELSESDGFMSNGHFWEWLTWPSEAVTVCTCQGKNRMFFHTKWKHHAYKMPLRWSIIIKRTYFHIFVKSECNFMSFSLDCLALSHIFYATIRTFGQSFAFSINVVPGRTHWFPAFWHCPLLQWPSHTDADGVGAGIGNEVATGVVSAVGLKVGPFVGFVIQ